MLLTYRLNHARKLIPPLSLRPYKPQCKCRSTDTKFFTGDRHGSPEFPNLKPLNAKISHLMRHGLVADAQNLFDEMPHRNTVTWNAMIRGYFLNRRCDDAVRLFDEMPERDAVSHNTVIAGLMSSGEVAAARRVFDGMGVTVRDVVSWNSMVSGYVRNGMVGEALRVFDAMPLKDVVSWNLVLGGLVRYGQCDLAGDYFARMRGRDAASWTIMVSGLASTGRIVEARELFEDMPLMERDNRAWNALIVGYIENGYTCVAEALFQKIPYRGLDCWTDLVNGLVKCGRARDAVRLFMEMPEKDRRTWNSIVSAFVRKRLAREAHAFVAKSPYSDVVSWTNVLVGYFEAGYVDTAVELFDLMAVRDATAYNVTIFGLGENDHGEKGIEIFTRMRESATLPDESTFTSVLIICSDLPVLQLGRQTHSLVVKSGFANFVAVCNAMITMYARCGDMNSSLLEFSSMPSRDIISWNSIICGFAHHGNGEQALEMFRKMRSENVKPNDITFVGVLSACSHAGLVELGRHYFHVMRDEYLLQPTSEHYTCVVDLLGRFGLIDEAASLLGQMRADGTEVPASVWGALLGACRIHNNIEVAMIAGERVLEMEPCNSGVYLILAEMYMSHGRAKDAKKMWTRMKDSGVKKQPGCSWVELNDSSHVFLSGDRSNSEFRRVSSVLKLLQIEMETNNSKSAAFW